MRFLRLKNPDPEPAPADSALTFTVDPVAGARRPRPGSARSRLTGEGNPVVATLDAAGVHVAGGSAPAACRGWTADATRPRDAPTPWRPRI